MRRRSLRNSELVVTGVSGSYTAAPENSYRAGDNTYNNQNNSQNAYTNNQGYNNTQGIYNNNSQGAYNNNAEGVYNNSNTQGVYNNAYTGPQGGYEMGQPVFLSDNNQQHLYK